MWPTFSFSFRKQSPPLLLLIFFSSPEFLNFYFRTCKRDKNLLRHHVTHWCEKVIALEFRVFFKN